VPPTDDHLAEGVRLFNERRFWHAHEAWETIWLESKSPFLQGLIQLAAAWHHVQRGNARGAERLFAAALEKLSDFPAGHCGIDRAAVEKAAREPSHPYSELVLLRTK
jgi:predicted metal-dependent hydrolase